MSGMFDLNSNNFDSSVIFNDGIGGVVDNVSLTCEDKKQDDKDNAPDLKVIFTDAKGGKVNFGLWHLNPNSENIDKDIKNLGMKAKHIFHAIFGPAYTIPPFKDDVDLINGLKAAINANPTLRYRVVTNYGTQERPKDYLQVKAFVPFMESMSTPKEDSKLFNGKNDLLRKVTPDATPTASSKPANSWVEESAPEEDKPVF